MEIQIHYKVGDRYSTILTNGLASVLLEEGTAIRGPGE